VELVEFFARELARYVGCSVQRIRRDGLRAGDFDGDVLVDLADGSTMTFTHAIVVQHKSKMIGIFTEHCGYYAFEPVDIRVSRVWDGHLFRRYGDLPETARSWAGTLAVAGRDYVAVPSAAYDKFHGNEATTDAIVFARLSIARDLRAARKHAGLTQRALARLLREPFKTVCKSELGRSHVSVAYVRKVLAACGLPMDWHAPARA
jgi:hypothetical protein